MEEQNEDFIIDLKYYFSEAYKIDFGSFSKKIEFDLNNLIKSEILNYRYSDVMVIGRKSFNLFQPYIKKIKKNPLQEIYTIKLFSFTEHPIVSTLHPSALDFFNPIQAIEILWKKIFGKIILLTDAIKTGEEVSEVIENLTPDKISKVCGYLANKNGLSQLQKKYPKIQFSFLNIVNDTNYDIEQDRLQYVYQSRLIPIDGDHPFEIYSLKHQMNFDDLNLLIINIINKYKSADKDVKKDQLIVEHISSYTINLDFNAVLKEKPDFNQKFFKIDRMQFRYKFDPIQSQLRIMVLALDLTDPNLLINEKQAIEYKQCGLKLPFKMCEGVFIPPSSKDNPQQKICPLCIDRNISKFIISDFELEFFKNLESIGVKIEKLYT